MAMLALAAPLHGCGRASGEAAYGRHHEGDARAFLPTDCAAGRGFFSFARARTHRRLAAMLTRLEAEAWRMGLRSGVGASMHRAQKVGARISRDVDEIAICAGKGTGARLAVALSPSVGDPLAVAKAWFPDLSLVSGDRAVSPTSHAALVGERVVVIRQPDPLGDEALAPHARTAAWAVDDGLVAGYRMNDAEMSIDARASREDDALLVTIDVELPGGRASRLDDVAAAIRRERDRVADHAHRLGLGSMVAALSASSLAIEGRRVRFALRVPIEALADLVEKTLEEGLR